MKIEKLIPAFKDYLWGGNRLKEKYGKNTDITPCAESWELSFVPGGEALADGAPLSEGFPKSAWGKRAAHFEKFPTLTKFIDAREKLSVQVHPDDAYAKVHEGGYGKSEMWYVVSADEGAGLYMGFKSKTTKEAIRSAVENGTVEDLLSFREVKAGDVFFIPAGTVHAIGAGVLIYEIQQNSTTTYRLYDYMRRDKSGNLRELHLDRALDVLTPDVYTPFLSPAGDELTEKIIGSCEYFTTREHVISDAPLTLTVCSESFISLTCVDGHGEISYTENGFAESLRFSRGDSFFIPATEAIADFKISGNAKVISVTI